MGRLPGFDYKRPFFYMVTLVGNRNAPLRAHPFSTLSPDGFIIPSEITASLAHEIAAFPKQWPWIESMTPYVIMPDHLHLMIKLGGNGNLSVKPLALGTLVGQLRKRLRAAYWTALQLPPPENLPPPEIFEPGFHDWIVKKQGQLRAFRNYIQENPSRAARRRANRKFFTMTREIVFQDRRYWAYGNEALLELPMIVAIKGHRHPKAGEQELPLQNQSAGLMAAAARIGPGGAGLSTFLSPLEKEAGNAIIRAGGSLIVLSMEGFAPRWHPPAKQEQFCAEGRLLYLSPYPPNSSNLTKQEMHLRAHDLVDWALKHSQESLEAWPT